MSCKYCNYASNDCEIFQDEFVHEFYLDHKTNEWDAHDDDFVHDKIYISYCPWCGQKLQQEGLWKPVHGVITPGGEPLYVCSNCGQGEHLYGVENPKKMRYCRDCGSKNMYPGEIK